MACNPAAATWSRQGDQIAFALGIFFQAINGPQVGDIATIDPDGGHLTISLTLPDRVLRVAAWRARIVLCPTRMKTRRWCGTLLTIGALGAGCAELESEELDESEP